MPSRSRMVPISCGCTPASVNDRMLALSCAVPDRKSTRLNSSHSQISYAVFCLKKKRQQHPLHISSLVLNQVDRIEDRPESLLCIGVFSCVLTLAVHSNRQPRDTRVRTRRVRSA